MKLKVTLLYGLPVHDGNGAFFLVPERPIFCSPNRQMDRSDGPLTSRFVLLYTNLSQKLCCIVQKGFSLEKVEWKELVRAEIETRRYVLGQQKKSTSNERQNKLASPELTLEANVNIKTRI